MSAEIAEDTISARKRFFTLSDVLAEVSAAGIVIDEDTVEYHLYRTKKMPRPTKRVKRERYWTKDQIESFISEL